MYVIISVLERREADCFKEVVALYSDHLRQVPLYTMHALHGNLYWTLEDACNLRACAESVNEMQQVSTPLTVSLSKHSLVKLLMHAVINHLVFACC